MSSDYKKWLCEACGYIYDEEKGDPDSGLMPGTKFQDIPDDWYCPLCGLSKADFVPYSQVNNNRAIPSSGKAIATSKGSEKHIVIVGAGVAGLSVAEEVRKIDKQVPIMIVSACEGNKYPKPLLSTALSKDKKPEELVQQSAKQFADLYNVEFKNNTKILKIDLKKSRLTTAKGGLRYGTLVLALGANQRELVIDGDAKESVIKVNDLTSYSKFRKRLDAGVRHVTILGGGLIGAEFAEDLTNLNISVRVVDPGERLLSNLLPEHFSTALADGLMVKGVDFSFDTTLDLLESCGDRYRATLSNGNAFNTDLVVSAAGLVPNTMLPNKSGLRVSKGIIVNEYMQTSVPEIYALGDCAEVNGKIFSYIEPIKRQAKTIAKNILGFDEPFISKKPLVTLKTPSYPIVVCKPGVEEEGFDIRSADPENLCFYKDDELIGFALAGDEAKLASVLYSEVS